MKHRGGWSKEERRIRSRLHTLIGRSGVLRASILTLERRCGNPNCRCARGQLHKSLVIEQHRRGRTRMRTVRPEQKEQVEQWVESWMEVKALMDDLSEIHWEKLEKHKGK